MNRDLNGTAFRLQAALGLGILLVACTALGQAGSDPDPDPDPMLAEMGVEPFARYCAACHGLNASGGGSVAPELVTSPADLTRIAARRGGRFPRGEIGKIIDGRFAIGAHGTREMPVWGERFGESIPDAGLSEEVVRGTIAILLEYLASIQAQ